MATGLGLGGADGPCLGEHLFFVLVHVDGVGAGGLGLGVGVNLTRLEPPRIILGVISVLLQ